MSQPRNTDLASIIVKVNFLLLGLFIVGYGIYHFRTFGAPWVNTLVGEAPQAALKITLCDTRIVGMILPNETKITQVGRKWMKEADAASEELDFLSVEKWFGEHCRFEAEASIQPENLSPVLIVKFVTDKVEPLLGNQSGAFVWRGQSFTSPALLRALDQLKKLPVRPASN